MPVLRDALAKRGLAQARIGLDYNSYCMPVARFARVQAALGTVQRLGESCRLCKYVPWTGEHLKSLAEP